MIPLSEFNSWMETNYLLSNKHNKQWLMESIKEGEQGKTTMIKTSNLWK